MKSNILYYLLFIVIIILFNRIIYINSLFFIYDVYSCFGLYWKLSPEYCSPMKYGFTPVMPLEFYSDFNRSIFNRIPSGNNTLNNTEVMKICDRNLEWLKKNGEINKAKHLEVLYVNQSNFKEKVMFYLKNDFPFVMRGIDLDCFETMRFDNLLKTARNNKVYMSASSEETCPDNVFTELKNIFKNKCYIRNCTNLFNYYKHLLPDSDMDIIKNMIDGYMINNSKQLFCGIKKDTGTELHSAYTNNFFLMIQGSKKWTFFNPNQLALLYPNFKKKGIYIASENRFINMDTFSIEKFPLIKYVERYETILEEKDVLYNPMSWFHSVHNLTEISVACSTRWSIKTILPFNFPDSQLLRYGHMINPELRNYIKEIYINTGVIGISQIDEHKHMIGENNPDAIPYWDKYTNDSVHLCKNEDCSSHWHKS
jgi:hypothetical protein